MKPKAVGFFRGEIHSIELFVELYRGKTWVGLGSFHVDMIYIPVPLSSWECKLAGCNSNMLCFSPRIFGEDEPILTSICFKWVGSTTNYSKCNANFREFPRKSSALALVGNLLTPVMAFHLFTAIPRFLG